MMSAQQLTPFNKNQTANSKWRELVLLAEQLLSLPELKSQLICIINTFERYFSCHCLFWLSGAYSSFLADNVTQENKLHLNELTDIMSQAYDKKDIFPKAEPDTDVDAFPSIVALPLIVKDEIIGIIQLERKNKAGFNHQDIEIICDLSFQAAMAIGLKTQETICFDLKKKYKLLNSIVEISKSITSNLDLENLLNSAITLIHQNFGFLRVNVFVDDGEDKLNLKRVGISSQGIEYSDFYAYESDDNPVSWVISHQETVVINDTNHESRFSVSTDDTNIKSRLLIPLMSGDKFVGVLDLYSDVIQAFGQNELEIFQSLSETIALAIRNAKIFNSEKLLRHVIQRLQDVIGRISPDTTYDEVLDNLLSELQNSLPYDASGIWLFDNVASGTGIGQFTSYLKLAALNVRNQSTIEDNASNSINIDEIKDQLINFEDPDIYLLSEFPWLSEVVTSKKPIIHNSDYPFEPFGRILSLKSKYCALGIPLYLNEQSIGIIVLIHHLPDRYTGESHLVASAFANFVSISIENARLYNAAHDQVWMSTVLQQVSMATQSMSTLDEIFETIINILIDLVGVNACTLYLWDQSMEAFFPQSSSGFDDEQQARLNSWEVYSGSVPAFDQLLQSRSPVILNSDTLFEDTVALIFPTFDIKTNLLVLFPMIAQDNLIGALLIDFTNTVLAKNSSQKLWDDTYTLIQGVSHQASTSIENLQIIKAREEEAYISVALLQVAQAIVSLNKLDEILGSIVRITPILVGVKRCIIFLWDYTEMVFRPTQKFGFSKNDIQFEGLEIRSDEFPLLEIIFDRNLVVYHRLSFDRSPSAWSEIQQDELQIIEGIALDSDDQFSFKLDDNLIRNKARLLIGFPLSVKGEVLGVMLIEEENPIKASPSYHIREKRIEIVKGITQLAAVAIKNEILQQEAVYSERMERELQLARDIQKTFLPDHLPTLPGWDMDIRWQPARQVAGDFYDIFLLGENRMGIVIADVADKGMPAALFMTLIRTLIRSAAKETVSPASVLRQVNELLVPDSKNGMFVTVFYAVIHLDTGKIVYTNAGHNPPIIRYAQSDELFELTRTCMALGIFNDIEVDEREVTLNPGDWILLYTDGVTEAFSVNEEMFGTKRLFDLLLRDQYTSSKELLDVIEGSVHEFITGTDLSDDLTLAAIFNKLTRQ